MFLDPVLLAWVFHIPVFLLPHIKLFSESFKLFDFMNADKIKCGLCSLDDGSEFQVNRGSWKRRPAFHSLGYHLAYLDERNDRRLSRQKSSNRVMRSFT